ncbi:MAG: presenilin family intramembrane aspartyl protease [Candidatus Woesearchaeota archaeon]
MKHTVAVTLILVAVFFCAQVVGLLVTNQYIDHAATAATGNITFTSLPYDIERPPVEESSSFLYIITAILIATALILLLIKFNKPMFWKVWFFLAVVVCLTISFGAFFGQMFSLAVSIILALVKIFKPNAIVHNFTEIFIYGGLAAIFVPIMNVFAAVMLLILISIYDMYAVWKSGHMVKLAKFQSDAKVFAGLFIPYRKAPARLPGKTAKMVKTESRNAVLGGGDIGFPLLFAGVLMKNLMVNNTLILGFLKAMIIPVFAATALLILLIKAKQDRFYPAMPFITAGCFFGWLVLSLI